MDGIAEKMSSFLEDEWKDNLVYVSRIFDTQATPAQ
jgi:hypothetical protein